MRTYLVIFVFLFGCEYFTDFEKPEVAILVPQQNEVIRDRLTIEVEANDNHKVDMIKVYVDDELVIETSSSKIRYTLPVYKDKFYKIKHDVYTDSGEHVIKARAYDVGGNWQEAQIEATIVPTPHIKIANYYFYGDSCPNAGDTIAIYFSFTNTGTDKVHLNGYKVTTDNPYITFLKDSVADAGGEIYPEDTLSFSYIVSLYSFKFLIAQNCPPNEEVKFKVNIFGYKWEINTITKTYCWEEEFSIIIH